MEDQLGTEALDRRVALKVPRFSADSNATVTRFYREARSAARLRHSNICPVFDIGEVAGVHFISMAYIEGQELTQLIDATQSLPLARIVTAVRKLALALHAAHEQRILHWDLKPSNIMIDVRDEPIDMDFGLARAIGRDDPLITKSGALVGSPSYMSPEQIEGHGDRIGPSSDMYSLGVILYQMLTGVAPFRGTLMSVIPQILFSKPRPPSELREDVCCCPALEQICMRTLAKRPEDRFHSLYEAAEALAAIESTLTRGGLPTSTTPSERTASPPLPPSVLPHSALAQVTPPPVITAAVPPPPVVDRKQAPERQEMVSSGSRMAATDLYRHLAASVLFIAICALLVFSTSLVQGWKNGDGQNFSQSPQPAYPSVVDERPPTEPDDEPEEQDLNQSDRSQAPPSAADGKIILPKKDEKRPSQTTEPPRKTSPQPQRGAAPVLPTFRLSTQAAVHQPFSVGSVAVNFDAGSEPIVYPDQTIQIRATDGRALYPAVQRSYLVKNVDPLDAKELQAPKDRFRLQRLTAYFLISDDRPSGRSAVH